MRIHDCFARNGPVFSFEFFPPKTAEGERKLLETVHRLEDLRPSFVSVTKTGAKPAEKTIEITARIKAETGIEAMAHMTCATAGRADMARTFGLIHDVWITNVAQIERIAALSGARIPPELQADLDRARDDDDAALAVGIAYATAQCRDLLRRGAPGIHFYTLNQSPATRAILRQLRADDVTS